MLTVEAEITQRFKQNIITTNLPLRSRLCTAACSPQEKLKTSVHVILLI